MSDFENSRFHQGEIDPSALTEESPTQALHRILGRAYHRIDVESEADDMRSDWKRMQDHATDLSIMLQDANLQRARAYIRYSTTIEDETDDDVWEEFVKIQGFAPVESSEGFELGLRAYVSAPSNFSAHDEARVVTVPLSDPVFAIELASERLEKACATMQDNLRVTHDKMIVEKGGDPLQAFPRDLDIRTTLDALVRHLKGEHGQQLNERKVARFVTRLANDPVYTENPSLLDDLEVMVRHGYPIGWYKLTQHSAVVTSENADDIQDPKVKELSKRACSQIEGSMTGLTILPRLNDRKGTLIPYFVVSPSAEHDVRLAPLERTRHIRRVGDIIEKSRPK